MLRPILLTALLLGFGITAVADGLDRMALAEPEMERLVPRPFRAQADRAAAGLALDADERQLALEYARSSVDVDPADSDATALLAAARLLDGDWVGGDEAMRVSARFGWRNLATQLYWFQTALRAEDYRVAVERADAILRVRPGYPQKEAILAPLERQPAARNVLIDRLVEGPNWLPSYFVVERDQPDVTLIRRATIAEQLGHRTGWTGCHHVHELVRELLFREYRGTAERVWNSNCPDHPVVDGLADANFAHISNDRPGPFGWTIRRSGTLDLRIVAAEDSNSDGQTIVMRNGASTIVPVLEQEVGLAPGGYRISADASVHGQPSDGHLFASIGCDSSAPFPDRHNGNLTGGGQLLSVGECAKQTLVIWLQPGSDDLLLESIEVSLLE